MIIITLGLLHPNLTAYLINKNHPQTMSSVDFIQFSIKQGVMPFSNPFTGTNPLLLQKIAKFTYLQIKNKIFKRTKIK